jgi:hypothetical protein
MKRTILTAILCTFLLPAALRAQVQDGGKSSEEATVEKLMRDFVSQIRPGETLRYGETYTDEFEYVGYSDGGDYLLLVVRKHSRSVPPRRLMVRFCFIHLKKTSICQRCR